jgi:AhpC/TSA family
MLAHILAVLSVSPMALSAVTGIEAGQQIVYHGNVTQRIVGPEQGTAQQKGFDLTWFVAEADASGAKLYWLVDERGRGAWPWAERFGQVNLDARGGPQGASKPSLWFDHGEGESAIPLPLPLVSLEQPLAKGHKWSDAGQNYEVLGEEKSDGRETWQVRVGNDYGVKQTMLVNKAAPLLVSLAERVFMNKGTEYALEMKLAEIDRPDAAQQKATVEVVGGLLALRAKLHRPPQSADTDWTPVELALLSEALPELEKQAAGGPLARLIGVASRDMQMQGGRAGEVTGLAAKFKGQPLPAISFPGLAGGTLSQDDLAGQVTVLHFWDYRDVPLKEPYGQVGYLEFLYQKRKDQGLKVYGVAVDGRLKDEPDRRAALSGIRKLKAFMNLSYPLVLDSGAGIKAVGDPRLVGATLPLVIVVGRDGRIAHYHVGYYEVDRQAGLKELDTAVTAAMQP